MSAREAAAVPATLAQNAQAQAQSGQGQSVQGQSAQAQSVQGPALQGLRVIADQDRCCGAGLCTLNVPEVFDQREEDGIVVVLDATPPADLAEAVREAVSLCPSGAISVVEPGEDDAGA